MSTFELRTRRASMLEGPLRYLAFVLVALQLGVAPAVVLADPPPTPASHAEHVGSAGDPGCQPIHDELTCLACRVLSTHPVGAPPTPALPVLAVASDTDTATDQHVVPASALVTTLRARAPPIS